MVLYTPFPLIWYATWLHSEKKFWTFDPTPGAEVVFKDRICAWVVLYAPFPLIWYATWLLSEQNCCELLTPPQGPRVCVRREYVLACALCYIPFNFICNMTTFRKKSFDLLTPPQGLRVCVWTEYVLAWCPMLHLIWYTTWLHSEPFEPTTSWDRGCIYRQNICYQFAACVIPFNLICNMTIFWKKLNFGLCLTPLVHPGDRTQAFELKSRLIWFIYIILLSPSEISVKILTTDLVIAKF